MAVTVSGTSITFNDATVQTTAAGAPTTAQVLSATTGATAGAVGSYAWLGFNGSSTTVNFNSTLAGSGLRPAGASSGTFGCTIVYTIAFTAAAQTGTWRCMGYYSGATYGSASLWLRIS